MKILITGGSGFIGSALARVLSGLNYEVYTVDILDQAVNNVFHIKSDFTKVPLEILRKIDVVYHLAAKLPIHKLSFREYFLENTSKTFDLLWRCKEANINRFIYVSSSAVYGYPECPLTEASPRKAREPYGHSKLLAEKACEYFRDTYGMNISIVRPRTVIGHGRLGILYLLFYWFSNNKNVYLLGDGSNKYQLLSLTDLIDALVRLGSYGSYQDFNLGAEQYSSLRNDLFELIYNVNSRSRIVSLPSTIGRIFCRTLDKLIPLAPWHYEFIDKDFYFDISKAKTELGWKPKFSNLEMLLEAYRSYLTGEYGLSPHKSPVTLKLLRLLP